MQNLWFFRNGYLQGAFWIVMICVASTMNDVLMRYTGENLSWVQIIFFRYVFSAMTILPFMMHKKELFVTKTPKIFMWRGLIGAIALGTCCYSVVNLKEFIPLHENTTILFTQPLFFLIIARLFLKEKVDSKRWLFTITGFMGLIVLLKPTNQTFQLLCLIPVLSALMFAILSATVKTMVTDNISTRTMIFYFAVGVMAFTLIPAVMYWKTPSFNELLLLIGLGAGANLIQVFLCQAFSKAEASSLMPFFYVEFVTASVLGYFCFAENLKPRVLIGASIIIFSTFFITYFERKREKALLGQQAA